MDQRAFHLVSAEHEDSLRTPDRLLVASFDGGVVIQVVMTVPCSPFGRKPLTCNAGVTITYVGAGTWYEDHFVHGRRIVS